MNVLRRDKRNHLACDGYGDTSTLSVLVLYQPVLLCFCCPTCLCCSWLLQLQWWGVDPSAFFCLCHYSSSCTRVCDSQTYYVYSERDTLNATQLKLKSLNSYLISCAWLNHILCWPILSFSVYITNTRPWRTTSHHSGYYLCLSSHPGRHMTVDLLNGLSVSMLNHKDQAQCPQRSHQTPKWPCDFLLSNFVSTQVELVCRVSHSQREFGKTAGAY